MTTSNSEKADRNNFKISEEYVEKFVSENSIYQLSVFRSLSRFRK